MANTKIERIDAEIQKARDRMAEYAARIRALEKQKTDEENVLIVQMVRKLRMTPADLERFLDRHKNTLTNPTKTPPITAGVISKSNDLLNKKESEDNPNENT